MTLAYFPPSPTVFFRDNTAAAADLPPLRLVGPPHDAFFSVPLVAAADTSCCTYVDVFLRADPACTNAGIRYTDADQIRLSLVSSLDGRRGFLQIQFFAAVVPAVTPQNGSLNRR